VLVCPASDGLTALSRPANVCHAYV
jgi:hypothetical protein